MENKKQMSKINVKNEALGFAAVAFLLLAVLFGMIIMTFIFANLETTSSILGTTSATVDSENGHINGTGYFLARNTEPGFTNPSITAVWNVSDNIEIEAANYTVSNLGLVLNATIEERSNVNFTYTYDSNSEARVVSDTVVNNSLVSIRTYSNQSNTQFTTVAIAITLIILIAVFLLFWSAFMGRGKKGGGIASGGAGSSNFSSGDDRSFG